MLALRAALAARAARDLLALLKLGIAGHLLHVGLVTYGIHWSTAFSSSLILGCGPLFTLLILRATGVETLTRGQVAGVAVALCGVLLFLSDKLLGGQWSASAGDGVLLVAASFFSYYTVAAKPLIEKPRRRGGDDLCRAAGQRAGGADQPARRACGCRGRS